MKLLIDIPQELYEEITCDEACGLHELTRTISRGTPLSDVLDKIRAEIEVEYAKAWTEKGYGLAAAIKIIDKYKEEDEK